MKRLKGNLAIEHAAQLVTCSGHSAKFGKEMADLAVIEDGAVVIRDGVITTIGPSDQVLQTVGPDVLRIDATGKAVLPGLVDSHTHLVWGGYRAEEFSWRLAGTSYMEIMNRGGGIVSTVEATRSASIKTLIAQGRKRLDSMLSFGVTTVEAKSGYGLDRDTELKQLEAIAELNRTHPIDVVPTFLGAHAVPAQYRGRTDAFVQFLMADVMPEVAKRGLAEFCDIFCEQGVFSVDQSRRLLTRARDLGFKLKLHADEIVGIGGAQLAAELGAVSADHLLQASEAGIDQLARQKVVATLLPATAFCLKEPYARARAMIDHGCAVALASDLNPGSCFTESIALIAALATLQMNMSPEETLTALTLNGAAALDRAGRIGSLDVGKAGDLIILEFPSYHYIPYHVGVSCVETVVKDGTVVFDKRQWSTEVTD
jgi:imidazolonepropionase